MVNIIICSKKYATLVSSLVSFKHTCLTKVGTPVKTLKPIFHWKWGSHWLPNANEIYTKKKKCTWPTPEFCVGTQRHLYSTDWRRGLALGLTQILGFASGVLRQVTQKMCTS